MDSNGSLGDHSSRRSDAVSKLPHLIDGEPADSEQAADKDRGIGEVGELLRPFTASSDVDAHEGSSTVKRTARFSIPRIAVVADEMVTAKSEEKRLAKATGDFGHVKAEHRTSTNEVIARAEWNEMQMQKRISGVGPLAGRSSHFSLAGSGRLSTATNDADDI
eukprot:2217002-Pleurochrysis_carterae.AAC.1